MIGPRWYVARTEPRAEFLAADELERDGHEVFFPRVRAPRPRLGHTDMPLFPGYLFLRCDPESEGWPSFRRAHRIAGWVGFAGEVPSLPDEVVAELMERWDTINRQGGFLKRFQPGEKVRIVAGSLMGLAEVVEAAKLPRASVKVLVEFMGRLVQAQVPLQHLEPIEGLSFDHKPRAYQAPAYQPTQKPRRPRRTRGKGRWVQGFGSRALAGA